MGRPKGPVPPLTDLQRQKGFNIRKKGGAPEGRPTRNIMQTKTWQVRNTKGSPVK